MPVDVIEELEKQMQHLEPIIESMLDEDEPLADLSDVKLSDALKQQVPFQMRWETVYRQSCWIVRRFEDEAERIYAVAFKELMSNSHKALNVTEAKAYALSDADLVRVKRLLREAELLKGTAEGMLDVIKTRSYTLKNICDTLISEKENYII